MKGTQKGFCMVYHSSISTQVRNSAIRFVRVGTTTPCFRGDCLLWISQLWAIFPRHLSYIGIQNYLYRLMLWNMDIFVLSMCVRSLCQLCISHMSSWHDIRHQFGAQAMFCIRSLLMSNEPNHGSSLLYPTKFKQEARGPCHSVWHLTTGSLRTYCCTSSDEPFSRASNLLLADHTKKVSVFMLITIYNKDWLGDIGWKLERYLGKNSKIAFWKYSLQRFCKVDRWPWTNSCHSDCTNAMEQFGPYEATETAATPKYLSVLI